MTDEKIIHLFTTRDQRGVVEIHKKYGGYCFKIANSILENQEDAKECVNDTLMKTWNSIPPAKPNHLKLFVAKITRNLAFNVYKAKHALKRGGGETEAVLEELQECIAGNHDVEAHMAAEELKKTINDFVRTLPEREGNIFIRRYFYVEPIKAIAGRYLLSESNVRVILNRTRAKLKERLEKEGYLV